MLVTNYVLYYSGSLTNGHMGYKKRTDDGPDTASDSSILFLYQLWPGQAESSFGMNVARMAGLPDDVVELATRVSDRLGMVKS
jgi:DNA mismatch repair protein MSH3